MRVHRFLLLCVAAALLPDVVLAQAADMSGTWVLNKKKSSWGSSVPFDVMMFIEHKEPILKYKGTITYRDETTRDFAYDGAIDGKPQPADRAAGSGTMTHTRRSRREFRTVFRNADGSYVQTVDTSLSLNGKTLTRALRVETPQGVRRWTEVYDRNLQVPGR
jgi:hypothetical protein